MFLFNISENPDKVFRYSYEINAYSFIEVYLTLNLNKAFHYFLSNIAF